MSQISAKKFENWRSQRVFSKPGAKMGLHRVPFAFTEHGALMAASVLTAPRVVEVSPYVVPAFVRLRETLAAHKLAFRALAEPSHVPQCQLASHPSR